MTLLEAIEGQFALGVVLRRHHDRQEHHQQPSAPRTLATACASKRGGACPILSAFDQK